MELLEAELTVWETLVKQFPMASVGSLRTLGGVFGFGGDAVEKRCKFLSGGEKARLVLALMLYEPPNFLVLDEPTNHLDLDTKEMLIEALADYQGTMLFVSHDRHFLRKLSNRVLEISDSGPAATAAAIPNTWPKRARKPQASAAERAQRALPPAAGGAAASEHPRS